MVKPRVTWLATGGADRALAAACMLVALTIPPLEIVPFAGSFSWAAIAAFGLALMAHDGVLAMIALAFSGGAGYLVYANLL